MKAALTAEEWAKASLGNGDFRLGWDDQGTADRHAVAAVCLHAQPFGFTREMAEAIRELVQRLGNVDPDLGHVFMVGEALEAADRIEALLPPEDA